MDKNMYTKRASLGKHGVERPSAKSKSRRGKWSVGIVAVALAGLLAVGGTIAWLVDKTDSVTNTFVPGQVTTEITEGFDGTKKSNVDVANTSNIPVYVRAQVVINWVDGDGNVVADVPDKYVIYKADGVTKVEDLSDQLGDDWKASEDGFFYYTKMLDAADDNGDNGGVTSNLIQCIEVLDSEYTLSVEILSEAIQAIPSDAVLDAWKSGVSAVGDDGALTIIEPVLSGDN